MSRQGVEVAPVLASYARCRERGGFIEAFYAALWARDPEIKRRFRNVDMDRQHEIMREAINTLLMYANGAEVAHMALERIGRIHARGGQDVDAAMYAHFVEALVETARRHDSRWEPGLEVRWRAALEPGLASMRDVYES